MSEPDLYRGQPWDADIHAAREDIERLAKERMERFVTVHQLEARVGKIERLVYIGVGIVIVLEIAIQVAAAHGLH